MKKHNTHTGKKTNLKAFSDYLKGTMTGGRRHRFERAVMSDPFEADAYDGLVQLSDETLRQDMKLLNKKLHHKTKGSSRRLWMATAASVAILIGLVSLLLWLVPRSKTDQMAVLKPVRENTQDTLPPAGPNQPQQATNAQTKVEMAKPQTPRTQSSERARTVVSDNEEEAEMAIENMTEAMVVTETPVISPMEDMNQEESFLAVETKMEAGAPAPANIIIRGVSQNKETTQDKSAGVPTASEQAKSIQSNREETSADQQEMIAVSSRSAQKKLMDNRDFESAKPPAGYAKYKKRIGEKLSKLNLVLEENYLIEVKIHISELGIVDSVEVLKSPNQLSYNQIVQAIKDSGTWMPATQNKQPTREIQTLSIQVDARGTENE